MKENQILLKLVRNLCILKSFNIYIMGKNKLNEFEETYKIIIDFEIFLFFFVFSFLNIFSLKFSGNQI